MLIREIFSYNSLTQILNQKQNNDDDEQGTN